MRERPVPRRVFRLVLAAVPLLVVTVGEQPAAADESRANSSVESPPPAKRLAFTLTGLLAPSYSNPTLEDAHEIVRGDALGWGLRWDARFRVLEWLAVGLGADYLATSSTAGPVHHLALPVIVAFTPLRTPSFELGAALGLGPAWAWYESSVREFGATTLRSSGTIVELRAEAGFPIVSALSIQTSLGFRRYGEKFSNGNAYAQGSIEAPARAFDFGIGARWRL